ncbi:MAG: TonB-dependent receptor [Deltaproteobacteria bacterium]|nr:TonB-dependent receptor [Deltaproteobacteria bacterium]
MAKLIVALTLALALTGIGGGPRPAWSQDYDMPTLVVTSSRTLENIREVTSNITVIDGETLENSSAATLEEILSESGFTITKYPGNLGTVSIRGYSTDSHGMDLGSHVLVLFNGRRLGTGNVSMIGLANVERVEIIRGPAAVQYGAAAMGGVVNVITKKGVGQPLGASMELGVGSFSANRQKASLIGSHGDFDFALGLFRSKSGSYKVGDGAVYQNTAFKNFAGTGEFGYSFLDTQRVALSFNFFDSPKSGSPGSYNPSGNQGVDWTKKYNYSVGLDYTGSAENEKLSWLVRYNFGKDYRGYRYPRNPGSDLWNIVDAQTGQAQLTYASDFWDLTGGFDYLNYDISQSANSSTTPDSLYRDAAFFLLGKTRLFSERLILSAGARQDFFSFSSASGDVSTKKRNLSPSLGIAYLPWDFLKIRAHFSKGFAMPTPMQLLADFTSSGINYHGNPSLQPEKSDSYEVGVELMGRRSNASASYFWTKTKNYIEGDSSIAGHTYYRNMDIAYRSGVELSFALDIGGLMGRDFVLKPSFNLTHMFVFKTRPRPGANFAKIQDIEDTVMAVGLLYQYEPIGLAARLSLSRHGKTYAASGGARRQGYGVVNLFVQKRVWEFPSQGEISAVLEVQNFTDELYNATASRYYMPGRSVSLGLRYDY